MGYLLLVNLFNLFFYSFNFKIQFSVFVSINFSFMYLCLNIQAFKFKTKKIKWLRIAITIWICEVPAVFDVRTMVEGRESEDIDSNGEDK